MMDRAGGRIYRRTYTDFGGHDSLSVAGRKEAMREQRKYSPEVKAEAVKMVLELGLTQQETGRRLSIPKGSIGNWVATAKAAAGSGKIGEPSAGELAAENARLRKELSEARMEREILRKATAYFAKESLPGTRS